METIKQRTRKNITITKDENPSPSGDPWYDDPENMKLYKERLALTDKGDGIRFNADEFSKMMGL